MAQQDSIIIEEIIDTVIIHKDPVIIKQEVIVFEEQPTGPFAIEGFIKPIYYSNYYDVCESCKNYLEKIKRASAPSLSFSSGISLSYFNKRIYSSIGIGYTSVKENFSYTDTAFGVTGKNTFNYLDANLLVGYKIFQKKLYVLLYSGIGINKHLGSRGFTLSKADTTLADLKAENSLANYTQSLIAGVNMGYKVSEKVNLSFGPEYSLTLRSVIRRDHFYTLQRNLFGLKVSMMYFL